MVAIFCRTLLYRLCRKSLIDIDSESNIENVDVSFSPRESHKADLETAVNIRSLRKKNPNKIIVAHLNINSIRNKLSFWFSKLRETHTYS